MNYTNSKKEIVFNHYVSILFLIINMFIFVCSWIIEDMYLALASCTLVILFNIMDRYWLYKYDIRMLLERRK